MLNKFLEEARRIDDRNEGLDKMEIARDQLLTDVLRWKRQAALFLEIFEVFGIFDSLGGMANGQARR